MARLPKVWVIDITYILTREGWLYLAGIKDLCSREIVGFSLPPRMGSTLVMNALYNAFHSHRPLPGLTLHSDRGSQYCSRAYQEKIKKYQMVCSMSRKGDCYGNAPMESFWGLLKSIFEYAEKRIKFCRQLFTWRKKLGLIISTYFPTPLPMPKNKLALRNRQHHVAK